MYFLVETSHKQKENHGREHEDFSELIRAVLLEWERVKDINIGILSLDSCYTV